MNHSFIDKAINLVDNGLKTLFQVNQAQRPYPAEYLTEPTLSATEQKQAAGYMRVNHAGEIAAQALYEGQQLTARDVAVKNTMQSAAIEEIDHLVWCEARLKELGSHTSYLAPLWFAGAFSIGVIAGLAGDKWSLGFLAETEQQVVKHLDSHLEGLPMQDSKSRAVIMQMRADESQHADTALNSGATALPKPLKKLMRLTAKIMTKTAYYL